MISTFISVVCFLVPILLALLLSVEIEAGTHNNKSADVPLLASKYRPRSSKLPFPPMNGNKQEEGLDVMACGGIFLLLCASVVH